LQASWDPVRAEDVHQVRPVGAMYFP
jgi:hypothetical protein